MLPVNADVQPTTHTLLAANGTPIPFEGEYKVNFLVAGKEFTAKSVHEIHKTHENWLLMFMCFFKKNSQICYLIPCTSACTEPSLFN